MTKLTEYPADTGTFYAQARHAGLLLHELVGLSGLAQLAQAPRGTSAEGLVRLLPFHHQKAARQLLGVRSR